MIEDYSILKCITAESVRKLVDKANDIGIAQCDIVNIKKFDSQYLLFYYG